MDDNIKVDIEGNLYFEGQKLTHDKIIEFFKKLDFEKVDDKTYQLKWQNNNQTQRINIIPEDTIFVIKDVVKESNEIKLVINDEKENFTRFVLVGTETMKPTGKDKTTIAFGVPYDKPGTLVGVLNSFSKEKVNLSRIESRPSRKALGEYIFYVDLEAHREEQSLKRALSEVASEFSFYRWLGSYPRWD